MGLHRIRLAAPWVLCRLAVSTATATTVSSTCKLPFSLNDVGADVSGSDSDTLMLSRKFHLPSGLDENTRVLIEIELEDVLSSASLKSVMLNGEALPVSEEGSATDGSEYVSSRTQQSDATEFAKHRLLVDVSGRLLAFNVLQLQFPAAASHTPVRLISVNLMIEE